MVAKRRQRNNMADNEANDTHKEQEQEEALPKTPADNNAQNVEAENQPVAEETENVENKTDSEEGKKETQEVQKENSSQNIQEEQPEDKPVEEEKKENESVKNDEKLVEETPGNEESETKEGKDEETIAKTEDKKDENGEEEKKEEPETVDGEPSQEKKDDGVVDDKGESIKEEKTVEGEEKEEGGERDEGTEGNQEKEGTEKKESGEPSDAEEKEGERKAEGDQEQADETKGEIDAVVEESKEEEEELMNRGHEVEAEDEEVRTATRLSDPRPQSGSPTSPPIAASPTEYEESEGGEELEELNEMEQEEYENKTRESLYKEYLELLEQRNDFTTKNSQYQNKIYDYFRRKKMDEGLRTEVDKAADNEQKYLKYMKTLSEIKMQFNSDELIAREHLTELREKCQDKQQQVSSIYEEFLNYKKEIALKSISTRSSKNISEKEIDTALFKEKKKEDEVSQVRLENHKLKHKLQNKEQQLKSKEELAEGLHLIDFEQLKIENQTYNEKIEERNEELVKLRKKITSTVQVLTHLKEKLQHLQAENSVKDSSLREVEQKAAKKRDLLSRTKQVRDALRNENLKLRQNCGLLGNEILLRDFEERVDEGNALKNRLEELKIQHAQLTLQANGIRQKIELAKSNMQGVQKFA